MPLIEPEPPSTLPRGTGIRRPSSFGCGVVVNPQFRRFVAIAAPTSAGAWMKGWLSSPPASSTQTRVPGSSAKRPASAQPPVPAPTIT